MTTYNGEKYIKAQLDSIISQLNDNDEIIISDDGSTDTTLEIINNYNDKRIQVFHHKKENRFTTFSFYRISKNFENSIKHCKGDLIFLSDQDDIWLPIKVETIKNYLNDKWLVVHDCKIINDNGIVIADSYFSKNKSKRGLFYNIQNSSYLGCCMAFKRELLDIAIPLPMKPVPHDIWIGLIAEWNKKVVFCSDKLLLYRRHDNNQSTSGSRSNFSFRMKVIYRLLLINALINRIITQDK